MYVLRPAGDAHSVLHIPAITIQRNAQTVDLIQLPTLLLKMFHVRKLLLSSPSLDMYRPRNQSSTYTALSILERKYMLGLLAHKPV